MIPDFISTSGAVITITVTMADYPDSTEVRTYVNTWTSGVNDYIIIRGRGRLARVQISSGDLGSFWRLGECLWFGSPTGRR
jgi:hypothetical protein